MNPTTIASNGVDAGTTGEAAGLATTEAPRTRDGRRTAGRAVGGTGHRPSASAGDARALTLPSAEPPRPSKGTRVTPSGFSELPGLSDRERRVELLLGWYVDVLESWRDPGAAGDYGLPMLNRVWNSFSFQQLERSRLRLRHSDPKIYWHLAEVFLRRGFRRVLRCPSCSALRSTADPGPGFHSHGGRKVLLVVGVVPVVDPAVRVELVVEGVRRVALGMRGPVEIPKELRW